MDELEDGVSSQSATAQAFTRALLLHIDGQWICIKDIEQAQACLQVQFADKSGPSYTRAVAMCETALEGKISSDAAQAALLVAAMEAEFAFEFLDEDALALERKVEAEAEKGLREFLFAGMAA